MTARNVGSIKIAIHTKLLIGKPRFTIQSIKRRDCVSQITALNAATISTLATANWRNI